MNEITRLQNGTALLGESPNLILSISFSAPHRAEQVLARVKEVLQHVIQTREIWPEVCEWRSILPAWFVNKCSEEISREEAELRRQLPPEQRQKLADHWSVGAWVYWFQPAQREWYWWDSKLLSEDEALIQIQVSGDPAPLGTLKWLCLAAGAEHLNF